jgi:hypothetical protein
LVFKSLYSSGSVTVKFKTMLLAVQISSCVGERISTMGSGGKNAGRS